MERERGDIYIYIHLFFLLQTGPSIDKARPSGHERICGLLL